MANTGPKKITISKPTEDVEDQLERLNGVLQNFMLNLDLSQTQQYSINNLSCSYNKPTLSGSFSENESNEENFDRKFEEILMENDRLQMKIEDLIGHSCRNVTEVACTYNEVLNLFNDLKDLLCGRRSYTQVFLPGSFLHIRLINNGENDYPNKSEIQEMFQDQEFVGDLQNKIRILTSENLQLKSLNNFQDLQSDLLNSMQTQFLIACDNPITENFRSFSSTTMSTNSPKLIIREATQEIERKNLKKRKQDLESTHQDLTWKLNEVKVLKETFLSRISELNQYKKQLEKNAERRLKELSTFFQPVEALQSNPSKRRHTVGANHIIPTDFQEDSIVNSIILGPLESSSEDIQLPVPAYKTVTLESLQDQLRFLEEKASTSSEPEKVFIEIERVKTRMTTLRGEQVIQDCKNSTKNTFRVFKTIEKTVKSENDKRGKLIKQYLRDSNGDSGNIKQEIETSIGKSIVKLEEKRMLQRRVGGANESLLAEQEAGLSELRLQVNSLFKHDEMLKKNLETKKQMLTVKENELRQREKYLMSIWKKHYSSKDIIDIVENVSRRLASEKEKVDREKERIENEKIIIFNKRLEIEVEKGRLKNVINKVLQAKKKLESDKAEVEKMVKQVNSLPSFQKCKY